MKPPCSNQSHATALRGKSFAHTMDWIRELTELHRAGLVPDEDFAYQRAEKLTELSDLQPRPWLAWVFIAAPLALLATAAAWWLTKDRACTSALAGIVALCVLAAIGRKSREQCPHGIHHQRLSLLRTMLAEDLLNAEEFAHFEDRLMRRNRQRIFQK